MKYFGITWAIILMVIIFSMAIYSSEWVQDDGITIEGRE